MACGTCVIGSDSGEIPHVIGDAGLIFQEDNSDQLHAHLQTLVNSIEMRQALGNKGRQRILDNFTQSHIAQATLEVYKELVP